MSVFIENTNLLRVTDVMVTAIDGTESLSTLDGEFTIFDSAGVEVTGQTWPTVLTLNTAGDYSGFIEADLDWIAGNTYDIVTTIGTSELDTAVFHHAVIPVERTSSQGSWVPSS